MHHTYSYYHLLKFFTTFENLGIRAMKIRFGSLVQAPAASDLPLLSPMAFTKPVGQPAAMPFPSFGSALFGTPGKHIFSPGALAYFKFLRYRETRWKSTKMGQHTMLSTNLFLNKTFLKQSCYCRQPTPKPQPQIPKKKKIRGTNHWSSSNKSLRGSRAHQQRYVSKVRQAWDNCVHCWKLPKFC